MTFGTIHPQIILGLKLLALFLSSLFILYDFCSLTRKLRPILNNYFNKWIFLCIPLSLSLVLRIDPQTIHIFVPYNSQ